METGEQGGLSPDDPTGINHAVVLAKLCSQQCEIVELGLETSVGLRCPQGRYFVIPKALHEDGYTSAQLDKIERTLDVYDLELRPLDPNLYIQ